MSNDSELQHIISQLVLDASAVPDYAFTSRLRYKGKLVAGNSKELRLRLLREFHSYPVRGHSSRRATFERISQFFYWPTLRADVITFVKECEVCQLSKHETSALPGLLQPLPIAEIPWKGITMDFIEGLPISHGYNSIMVVIDRLTKYAHFICVDKEIVPR